MMRDVLDADRQNRRPAHRPKKTESVYNGNGVVNGYSRPVGNSAAAALRRLERHRPDLLDRVLAGELSVHAAMTAAGFRRRHERPRVTAVERLMARIAKLSLTEMRELERQLGTLTARRPRV